MPQAHSLISRLEAMLDALPSGGSSSANGLSSNESISTLLEHCTEELSASAASKRIRTIHHFACTGGTLMSRCIAAQPNTVLLSEIDPLSQLPLRKNAFSPYDILKQAQIGLRPLSVAGVEETFLAGIRAMQSRLIQCGRRLVLRDHAHSQFCTGIDPESRPTLREILTMEFETLGIVTVRHPLDAYLSLKNNKWIMFTPATFEEYCRRTLLFLESYKDLPVFRYEDFVLAPNDVARRMVERLDLPYSDDWRELLPAIAMTGDSGRGGASIEIRPRRDVPPDLASEVQSSSAYLEVCERLGYPACVDASPYEGM